MDLSNLNLAESANVGAVMEVVHPVTGEVLKYDNVPMSIHLLGRDSDAHRIAIQRIATKQLGRQSKPNAAKLSDEAIELLVACTVGWYGIQENNAILEFNEANVRHVYLKYAWLRQQVDEFIADRANFFKA